MNDNINKCDVLVVGAGVAGLFAAWRLLRNNQNLSIIVTEKLDRIGGRLETTTVQIQGNDGIYYTVRDEEGGMRFVPEGKGMTNLWKLINDLNLPVVPFPMGDGNNRYNFRGKPFTFNQAAANSNAIWGEIYNLDTKEQNLSPLTLLTQVMQSILDQNPGGYQAGQWPDSPETWIQFRNTFTYNDSTGTPQLIRKWGFWNLLHTFGMTDECIDMLDHAIGFMGPFEDNINAGDSLQIIFDFPSAVVFNTLQDGYQSLPDALHQAIALYPNVSFVLNECITSVTNSPSGMLALSEANTYVANKVILAVPKNAIKKIAAQSQNLSSNTVFMNAVSSVRNMELSKVGLYFSERWWHAMPSLNISNGPNFTDLPLGSIYTFSQFPNDSALDQAYVGPAALTLYTDFIRGNFWRELQLLGPKYQTLEFPVNPEGSYPASINLVNEMMSQIRKLFAIPDNVTIPMPVLSTYRQWGEGDLGYGYHQYKIDVDDVAVYNQIYNPSPNVFVCNEAWSPEQGWVEGSLLMSDLVMQWGFGLAPYTPDSANFSQLIKRP